MTETSIEFGPDSMLSGTVFRPAASGERRPGIVLVHGSGEQDRRGYASIIQLFARRLAEAGMVVLTYDKRGVGRSRGDWQAAGFDILAADAAAGMMALRALPDVDSSRVGLAGSSQAGWVVARAIADGAGPAHVLLLGAAGSAMRVDEQNLYFTDLALRCESVSANDRRLALDQQRAFFEARRNAQAIDDLRLATRNAAGRAAIGPWLFPETVARSDPPAWYDVLDPSFDPLPVWRRWRGDALFLFGAQDESTDAALAVARLRRMGNPSIKVRLLPDAQHLGLVTRSSCITGLDMLGRFHPQLWPTIEAWAATLGGTRQTLAPAPAPR